MTSYCFQANVNPNDYVMGLTLKINEFATSTTKGARTKVRVYKG